MTAALPPYECDGPVRYRILGDDIQTVEFLMEPGDHILAQPGTFLASAGGVDHIDINFGRKARDIFKRRWAGEAPILHELTCAGEPARACFSAPQIGKIVRLPVRDGRSVVCQRGAFLAATGSIDISVAVTRRLRAGLFGGQGAVFQRLSGDGDVFLHALGNVIDWFLPAGRLVRISERNILAFDDSIGYDIQAAGGFMTVAFGGDDKLLAQCEGPGRVLVQSLDVDPGQGAKHRTHWWNRSAAQGAPLQAGSSPAARPE